MADAAHAKRLVSQLVRLLVVLQIKNVKTA
jgi:hypothetical protein